MPKVRPLGEDFHWIWAAYKNGEGGLAPNLFAKGLEQEEFRALLDEALNQTDGLAIMEGRHVDKGIIPMGLASMRLVEDVVMPHFDWFWWSTPRNKLECGLKFFFKYGEDFPFFIAVPAKSTVDRYLNHLVKYQVVRHVGTSHNWGKEITALYESRPCLA